MRLLARIAAILAAAAVVVGILYGLSQVSAIKSLASSSHDRAAMMQNATGNTANTGTTNTAMRHGPPDGARGGRGGFAAFEVVKNLVVVAVIVVLVSLVKRVLPKQRSRRTGNAPRSMPALDSTG